ncbi:MAG TPA: cytochrome C, partial [Burkholderiales bacterium]
MRILWVVLLALFAAGAVAQDKDKVLNGDAKCTACHDENDGTVLMIGQTKHGTRADKRTPTCTSCHGESDAHLKKPAAGGSRAKPDITFSKHSKTP